jgi:hypothetical protein
MIVKYLFKITILSLYTHLTSLYIMSFGLSFTLAATSNVTSWCGLDFIGLAHDRDKWIL